MKIVTAAQMNAMDHRAVEEGICSARALMQHAAEALFQAVSEKMDQQGIDRVLLLAGSGNNGGDAYALALLLAEKGYRPALLQVGAPPSSEEARFFCEQCRAEQIPFEACAADFPLVVDGVFGTGFHGQLPPAVRALFETVRAPVIAIDLPSGMEADSGAAAPGTMTPCMTVTFAFKKPCHFLADCGQVVLADIGIPADYAARVSCRELQPVLPRRDQWGHKNSYGTVGLLVGAPSYQGAASLAITGALNSGAGLVFGYLPREVRGAVAAKFYGPVLESPEHLFPLKCDCYLAGSGLGREGHAGERVRALWHSDCPLVVDGDGLFHLKDVLSQRGGTTVLTPHMGEFMRLTGASKETLWKRRIPLAEEFAKEHRVILVLKDAATLVTDGKQTELLSAPCSALAKGGSGDLLAGLIAGLLAGGCDTFSLVKTGVYLHNRAAHLAVRGHSVRTVQPEQVARFLDQAWMELEHGRL